MYLIELIAHKEILDQKIEEVKALLAIKPSEALAAEFMDLLEIRQSKLINIHRANEQSKLSLGGTEISITLAVLLRDTIKEKVDTLTSLIRNPENDLDKLELQAQRDQHFNEYTLLNMSIIRNDLNVKVG